MAVFGKSKHHIWRSFSQKFRINHKKAKLQLREKLVNKVDYDFYNDFGDRFFKRKSLDELLQEYGSLSGVEKDNSGKRLLGLLKKELIELGRTEKEIYAFLTEYIVEQEKTLATTLAERIKRIL
jgi:hypothetical protein